MRLGVTLLTYNRYDYAERTLRTALDNIVAGDLELQVHIASDGDTDEYIESLRQLAGGYKHVIAATSSNSHREGYGANYNIAMQTVHARCEVVLPLEDDWELTRPIYVPGILKDMTDLDIGCARMGYIGFTQDLTGTFAISPAGNYWLKLDPESPEPHVFAGHPRIETREWSRAVGPWPQGLKPGETEFAVAHISAARKRVGWPLDVHPSGNLFVHIGARPSYER